MLRFAIDCVKKMNGWRVVAQLCSRENAMWAKMMTLRPGSNFHAIHVDYVDFVPELGWRFRSRNL